MPLTASAPLRESFPEPECIGTQCNILGESPLWDDRAQCLYWPDIRRPALRRLHPVTGEIKSWPLPGLAGSIALTDDHQLWVALPQKIVLFDPATGTMGTERVFAASKAPAFACGLAVDAEGFLWNARFNGGQPVRYAPHGRFDRALLLPVRRPTCCAFGGPDPGMRHITTASQNMDEAEAEMRAKPLAGALLALKGGVCSLPEPRFSLNGINATTPARPGSTQMNTQPITLACIEEFCFRVPVQTPIKVAFGTFRDRPFVLVHVVDTDGAKGWGEAWCNWPAVGAEHRARLVVDLGERLIGRCFASAGELLHTFSKELEMLVLQTLNVGPIAQAVAGIDIAVWDRVSCKAGKPLYRLLRDQMVETVPVYATGINPDKPEHFALARQAKGHRAFKLKTGFGHGLDLRNLREMRKALDLGAVITGDANQSHMLSSARALCDAIKDLALSWFEEPIRVDAPDADWRALAAASKTPLAGGEKFPGAQFTCAPASPVLQLIQPDIEALGRYRTWFGKAA